jgi:hypothetical protein
MVSASISGTWEGSYGRKAHRIEIGPMPAPTPLEQEVTAIVNATIPWSKAVCPPAGEQG